MISPAYATVGKPYTALLQYYMLGCGGSGGHYGVCWCDWHGDCVISGHGNTTHTEEEI